jgi:hypothetical protein
MRTFRTWTCVVVGALGMHAGAQTQRATPEDQLPPWARQQWQALAKADGLRISTRINPFAWRGDFDGDGRADIALLVVQGATGKEGMAILLRNGAKSMILGAGRAFGNGGDDFAWMDTWTVVDRDARTSDGSAPSGRSRGDSLLVAREGSASALIAFEKGVPKWRQQGD